MSFGLMRENITIYTPAPTVDEAGFANSEKRVKARVRAFIEHRHATSAWVNRAAFTKATALFRFRLHPAWTVDERDLIEHGGQIYLIDSVEVIRGRYVEILAHHTTVEGAGSG